MNGDARAVQVDATQSNVAEVLSALESIFRLRVNTSTVLDRSVSGTFTGSLAQILSRVLQGYNYFIRHQATEIEVTVIGPQGDRAAAVARPRLPTNSCHVALRGRPTEEPLTDTWPRWQLIIGLALDLIEIIVFC